ncbi:MAG: metal-dependent hydrolase [Nanoarchaeota archaeon]|nr:metal-dependent hydrolase [Nanoarchaeota archaeon]|tara:strand:- start:880 stop:1638 length:759 start_codon:yes stop_codon:yes gene_type:complete
MNWTALLTLIKRENLRTIKIINQVIWPPIISSLLYIFIFGFSLGKNFEVGEVSYLAFLVPGLIMMNIIMSSFDESSSSLFLGKFINYIQELLIAPMSYLELVLGFLFGSILRAFVIANLILLVFVFFIDVGVQHIGLYLYFTFFVSLFFASIGLIVALWAEKFDHLAILNTFFITPLLFFGGVFHSIKLLPEFFQKISLINPLFYMIDGFRFSMLGTSDGDVFTSMFVVLALALVAFFYTLYLFRSGYKLKQ